jgi:hypothetical protein
LIGEFCASDAMTESARSLWATLVAALFLIPINHFSFYIMTFSKDAWMMIILLWVGALSFRIHRGGIEPRSPASVAAYVALVALMGLAPYARHNALVLLPPLCLVSLLAARRPGRGYWWPSALLPIAAFVLWHPVFFWTVSVQETHPVNQIKALDLIRICILAPAARADLSYTDACLAADYRARYRFGDYAPIYLEWPSIVRSIYITGRPSPRADVEYFVDYQLAAGPKGNIEPLDRDYRTVLRKHAATLLRVKALAFLPLLGLNTYRDDTFTIETWVNSGIAPNGLGLRPNPWLEWPRHKVSNLAWRVAHSPLRWISGVHAVWLAATMAAMGVALLRRRHGPAPARHRLFRAAWLVVLLAYYLSYLSATPSPEYRLMWPATMVVQVYLLVCAACFIAAAARGARRRPVQGTGALGSRFIDPGSDLAAPATQRGSGSGRSLTSARGDPK